MGAAGECCGTEMAQVNCLGAKLLTWKEWQQSVASRRLLGTAVVTQTQHSLEEAVLPSAFPIAARSPNTFFVWTHTSTSKSGQGTDPTEN